jgi:hypothetical protein
MILREISPSAIRYTRADTANGFILLSEKTYKLTVVERDCQDDLTMSNKSIERIKVYYGYETKSWVEKAWDSDTTKCLLFLGGIWLGVRTAHSVN